MYRGQNPYTVCETVYNLGSNAGARPVFMLRVEILKKHVLGIQVAAFFIVTYMCMCVCVCVSRSEDVRTANIIAFDPDGVNCLVLEREYVAFVVVFSRMRLIIYDVSYYYFFSHSHCRMLVMCMFFFQSRRPVWH